MQRTLFAVLIVTLLALPAGAWNSLGHRAVAEIAWRQMSQKERRAATDLLKQHPHYKEILTANVPPGADIDEWAFLTAAVWPDQVRPAKPGQPHKPESITRYNIHPHGIDLPFMRPGDYKPELLNDFPKPKSDFRDVISDSIATLKNRKASPHDRAVSLSLLLHFAGDSHQPLHAAALVTKDKPKGYGGGGTLMVRKADGELTNLHTYWDRLPGLDLSYAAICALADKLTSAAEYRRSALKEYRKNKTVASWVWESHEAAVKFAYDGDRIRFVDSAAIKAGKVSEADVPRVPDSYTRDAKQITERRLALAAHRLTDILKRTW